MLLSEQIARTKCYFLRLSLMKRITAVGAMDDLFFFFFGPLWVFLYSVAFDWYLLQNMSEFIF